MAQWTADDLLWNWVKADAAGPRVGNMDRWLPEDDEEAARANDFNVPLALEVDKRVKALPAHERLIILAEYPLKNRKFSRLQARERHTKARQWIFDVTGTHLTDTDYKLYLGLFKNQLEREIAQ